MTLLMIKINAIAHALAQTGGNRTQAAKDLGVSIRCIRMLIAKGEALGVVMTPSRQAVRPEPVEKKEFVPDKRRGRKWYCGKCGAASPYKFYCVNCRKNTMIYG